MYPRVSQGRRILGITIDWLACYAIALGFFAGGASESASGTADCAVSVASATCYTQDLTVPVGGLRAQDAARDGRPSLGGNDDIGLHAVPGGLWFK